MRTIARHPGWTLETWQRLTDQEKTDWLAWTLRQDELIEHWQEALSDHPKGSMNTPEVATQLFIARL